MLVSMQLCMNVFLKNSIMFIVSDSKYDKKFQYRQRIGVLLFRFFLFQESVDYILKPTVQELVSQKM
jgi:hypothetical protein